MFAASPKFRNTTLNISPKFPQNHILSPKKKPSHFPKISQPFSDPLRQPEQINKIFELCGSPDEIIWPGVSRIQLYNKFKSSRPMKRRVREVFRQFDRNALELLEKMLTLDPLQLPWGEERSLSMSEIDVVVNAWFSLWRDG